DVGQSERDREGNAARPDVLPIEADTEPSRPDLGHVDARIAERLIEGLDHESVGIVAPALAEAGAAHAEDRDPVLDAARHDFLLLIPLPDGPAFRPDNPVQPSRSTW